MLHLLCQITTKRAYNFVARTEEEGGGARERATGGMASGEVIVARAVDEAPIETPAIGYDFRFCQHPWPASLAGGTLVWRSA